MLAFTCRKVIHFSKELQELAPGGSIPLQCSSQKRKKKKKVTPILMDKDPTQHISFLPCVSGTPFPPSKSLFSFFFFCIRVPQDGALRMKAFHLCRMPAPEQTFLLTNSHLPSIGFQAESSPHTGMVACIIRNISCPEVASFPSSLLKLKLII